jgi:hypothetical protein
VGMPENAIRRTVASAQATGGPMRSNFTRVDLP